MSRRLVHVPCTKRRRFSPGSQSRIARWRTVLRLGVPFQGSLFSNVHVRPVRAVRARRCDRVSAGQCIPHVLALAARVPWELDRVYRLQEPPRVRAAARVGRHADPASATFLVG